MWRIEAPPKIKFFIWLLLKGKILTAENLRRRGIIGPSKCPNCCKSEETMHHLFIECPVVVDCWGKMASIRNINWEPQRTIVETIYKWRKDCPWKEKRSSLGKRVWNALPRNLLWRIWLARNHKVFQDKGSSIRKIYNKAKTLALEMISVNTTGKIEAANYSTEKQNLISYILENNPNAQEVLWGLVFI